MYVEIQMRVRGIPTDVWVCVLRFRTMRYTGPDCQLASIYYTMKTLHYRHEYRLAEIDENGKERILLSQ